MKESFYVLTFPKRKPDPASSGANLWYEDMCGHYVAIDYHSGGYPYAVKSLTDAAQFHTLDAAKNYGRHWPWMCVWRVDAEPVAVIPEPLESV